MTLVKSYVEALRHDPSKTADEIDEEHPSNKGSTIRVYLAAVTSVIKSMNAPNVTTEDRALKKLVQFYEDNDGHVSAPAFDFVTDLLKLWKACWSIGGWGFKTKLRCWTMLLISISLMARASCIAGHYCPLAEDILLPESDAQWDLDGYPKWVDIGLR